MILPWIEEAKKYLGTKKTDPAMQTFVDVSQAGEINTDTQPWAGLFMGFIFAQSGIAPPAGFLDALAWKGFGEALTEPQLGCVIVFERGKSPDHVALYMGEDTNWYFVLGGNQADTVGVAAVAKTRAVAFRWPTDADASKMPGRVNTTIDAVKKSIAS